MAEDQKAAIDPRRPRKKRPEKQVRKTGVQRRAEIAEATVKVIAKHGLSGATIARIAAASGLSKGALYRHYRNREEVLSAAVEVLTERARSWVEQPVGSEAMHYLVHLGEAHTSWSKREFDSFVRPMFQVLASRSDPELMNVIERWRQERFQEVLEKVNEGKHQGSIRADVDSVEIAWSVLAICSAEDVARLLGIDELLDQGISQRVLRRLLSTYANPSHSPLKLEVPERSSNPTGARVSRNSG